jgi:hypothetical protein
VRGEHHVSDPAEQHRILARHHRPDGLPELRLNQGPIHSSAASMTPSNEMVSPATIFLMTVSFEIIGGRPFGLACC